MLSARPPRRDPGRRLARFACAAALAAAVGGAPAHAEIDRPAAFRKRVDETVERATHHLLRLQASDGSWNGTGGTVGMTALCYHALSVTEVPQDDPDMRSAYARLEQLHEMQGGKLLGTYQTALLLMAIEDHATRGGPNAEEVAADRAWAQVLVADLEHRHGTAGGWSYSAAAMETYDMSNTQYALLGLKAAARTGARVKSGTFLRALRLLVRNQETTGPRVLRHAPRYAPRSHGETRAPSAIVRDMARGWNYADASGKGAVAYGSMTAAGVSSVVICRSELLGTPGYDPATDAAAERAARDGLAWLGRHFSVRRNPPQGGWHYYYLYGLERAGMLANVDYVAGEDWYGEGAKYLLSMQRRDGSWPKGNGESELLRTCFAILFLKRGTTQVKRGSLTPVTGERAINFDVAGDLSSDDFDDFIDLVLSRYRRARDDEARAHILLGVTEVGPRIVLPLLRRMDANDAARRAAAHAVLRHATGLQLAYDADATGDERAKLLAAWEMWFLRSAKRLRYDAESGRIVVKE